ncbi:MAG: hypothetical protein H7Z17_16865 [Fuerstia sp.]|nr:hypothetical protein [Fuerstiella sp.]
MRCKRLILLSILLAGSSDFLAAEEPELPELIIPSLDAVEQPTAATVANAAGIERQEAPREAIDFIRGIALLLIPQEFDDDDGWGDETRIQSGLNIRFNDGQLETNRRWKHVNHGSWLQATGKLVDPEERFLLSAARLPEPEKGTQRYDVEVSARVRVTGRQQQWSYGVMLWSISAEAVADVNLHLTLDAKSEIVQTDKGTRLRFIPKVTQAEARLTNFSLRRISHLKGKPVQEFGDLFEKLIRKRVDRENKNLATRINKALEKKRERLEIPFDIAGWFNAADSKAK